MKNVIVWNGLIAVFSGGLGVFNFLGGRYFLSDINWFVCGACSTAALFCVMVGRKQ